MKTPRHRAILILSWIVGLAPAVVMASPEQLCEGQIVMPGADGRVLGHIPYRETEAADLVTAPAGFALGQSCLIHRDAAPDLERMLLAAAGVPGVAGHLRAVSCYRSIVRQRGVFCSEIGPTKMCKDAAERARSVGPPGFSEHATGYAIDFGIRPSPGCPDVDDCMATTAAGKWLLVNAPGFGFELSFPSGNAQNVTWEPWHWRWVGRSIMTQGASRARAVFGRARMSFPARPGIADQLDRWVAPVPVAPVVAVPEAPPPGKKKKKR